MFSAIAEPPLWIMSTYFPFAENLRSMISAGNGFAGLVVVSLNTAIRALCYHYDGDGHNADALSFKIFFGVFWGLLGINFLIALFMPHMATFRHFEHKAHIIISEKEAEQEIIAGNGDGCVSCASSVSSDGYYDPVIGRIGQLGPGEISLDTNIVDTPRETPWLLPEQEQFQHSEDSIPVRRESSRSRGSSISWKTIIEYKRKASCCRFLSLKFLSDISLSCNLIFATLFTTMTVWPILGSLYLTGNDGPDLGEGGWPFNLEGMEKW